MNNRCHVIKIFYTFIAAFLLMLCFTSANVSFAAAKDSVPKIRIACTSPWLSEIASFIGYKYISSRSLSEISNTGTLHNKAMPFSSEYIIAYDIDDIQPFRINLKNKRVKFIYPSASFTERQMQMAFFDPAMLQFIAQNVMKILSSIDEKHYNYYQRRLAQYQSKIESIAELGTYILNGIKILDITGMYGSWVRTATNGTVRPPVEIWNSWLEGDIDALNAALNETQKRGWLIILDAYTPKQIREVARLYPYRLTIESPKEGKDYFTYIQEIYNSIAKKVNQYNNLSDTKKKLNKK